jgi:hypothetical protein
MPSVPDKLNADADQLGGAHPEIFMNLFRGLDGVLVVVVACRSMMERRRNRDDGIHGAKDLR